MNINDISFNIRTLVAMSAISTLGGCAYVTAVPTLHNPEAKGIRVYAPKTLLLVDGTQATKVIVPDCSKEYALQIGTVFAKQKATIEMAEGMVTKIDVDQDTTAIPLELIKLAAKAIPGGTPTSKDAPAGKLSSQAQLIEAKCVGDQLSLNVLASFDVQAVAPATVPPKVAPAARAYDDPNTAKGRKLPD